MSDVYIVKLAESRRREIAGLAAAVENKTSNTLLMQTLPKHMRRRAMSHNINRLPRRLRDRAINEVTIFYYSQNVDTEMFL